VEYSCPGFILLGLALERILAAPLDVLFARRVLAPLGLTEAAGFRPSPKRPLAGAASSPSVEVRKCRELEEDPATVPPMAANMPDDGNARFLGGVAANAGLFGTAAAVHRLASQYVVGAGELLEPDEIALATTPTGGGTAQGEQLRGLGWQLARSPGCSAGPALSATAFGHTGFTGTSVWVDPERRAVLVLLMNRHHPGHHEVDLHPLRRRLHALVVRQPEPGRSHGPSGP
jgi:CubicO group peptidase (beta-lactamase class C family)